MMTLTEIAKRTVEKARRQLSRQLTEHCIEVMERERKMTERRIKEKKRTVGEKNG